MVTCTRGLKRGCPMQDGKIDNNNNNKFGQTILIRKTVSVLAG